jgi:hypothetical protein
MSNVLMFILYLYNSCIKPVIPAVAYFGTPLIRLFLVVHATSIIAAGYTIQLALNAGQHISPTMNTTVLIFVRASERFFLFRASNEHSFLHNKGNWN